MTQDNATIPAIRQSVLIDAPIDRVWEAAATEEGIAAWFMPPSGFEPVAGCEFKLNAGPFGMSPCKVIAVEPPRLLTFTWDKDWTVSFELEEADGRTRFTLIHDGWSPDAVTAFGEPHARVRERMAGGWVGILEKLVAYAEGRTGEA